MIKWKTPIFLTSLWLFAITCWGEPQDKHVNDAVSAGVLNLLSDPTPVFQETVRILSKEGLFAFVLYDRDEREIRIVKVEDDTMESGSTVTLYLHSRKEIEGGWFGREAFKEYLLSRMISH